MVFLVIEFGTNYYIYLHFKSEKVRSKYIIMRIIIYIYIGLFLDINILHSNDFLFVVTLY